MLKLLQNYHMHTTRCGHATGEDREYVEQSIQNGYQTVGFSDHTPFLSMGLLYNPNIRMQPDSLEGYVNSVLRLRDEYRTEIRILLGLEVEYYPNHFEEWKKLVQPFPFDYFLLGQHYIGNTFETIYSGELTSDESRLRLYVDQVSEAMKTGTFLYCAHPDLIRFRDTKSPFYRHEMQRLCEAAKEQNIPLEINLLGMTRERWYPNCDFWKIAGEIGNDVVIGADAHDPTGVYPEKAVETAEKMIQRFHLNHRQNLL